jgi:hypothetical protein
LSSEEAADVFARGVAWACDPRWDSSWTSKSLGHLLLRSLEASSSANNATRITKIADFPLPGEKNAGNLAQFWPEPSMGFEPVAGMRRPETPLFAVRLRFLTECAKTGSPWDRQRALHRLYKFHKAGVLTDDEIKAFAIALWASVGPDGLPLETSLHTFAFLDLPEVALGQAEAAIRTTLLPAEGIQISEQLLRLLAIQQPPSISTKARLVLDAGEAIRCLDAILDAPLPKPENQVDFFRNFAAASWSPHLGAALAVGILPPLDIATVGVERLDRLVALIESQVFPSATQAWPQIIRLAPASYDRAVTAIVTGLLSSDDERVNAALWAAERWRSEANIAPALPVVPRVIIRSLASIVATRKSNGLLGALRLVANCCRDTILDECDLQMVLSALDALIDETNSTVVAMEDDSAALRAGTLTLGDATI